MRAVFLLDSGAYTVFTKGAVIKVEDYAEFVHENGDLFRGGVLNLDVIGSDRASYENWLELGRLGIRAIPVHHRGDDEKYLVRYLDATDYVAFGALANVNKRERVYVLDHLWRGFVLGPDGVPRLQVHGLGITDNDILLRYPWFSVDSTHAIMHAAHGMVLMPRLSAGGEPDYSELRQLLISDQTPHGVGSGGKFYSQSTRQRTLTAEYFRSLGYAVDLEISRPRKQRKTGPGLLPRMLEEAVVEDTPGKGDSKNLTRSWRSRYELNLVATEFFLRCWRRRGKFIRMYHVNSSIPELLNAMLANPAVFPTARCLHSFALITGAHLSRIRETINAN